MLKLAIFVCLANLTFGAKVRERFNYGHLSRTPVRIMAPSVMPSKDSEESLRAMFTDEYVVLFPKANYTSVFADTFIVGYRGEDGNYTGMIGDLINDQADYGLNFALLSQHEQEPVRVGVVLLQANLKIYSDDWKPNITGADFVDTFQNVRIEFALWLLLSMHIVAVVFVWLNLREFDVKKYAAIYWYGGLSMIGQESLSCSKWKPRVLWLHTCVAIFIAVFGIILNLMSSDSIVIRDPPRIDSIDDMFIEPFSSFKVYMYKTTTFYNYMRNAPPGSAMAAVFKRASDRSNCSRLIDCGEIEFRTDPQGSLKLLSFYDELVASRDHALFTADMIMDQAMAPSACRFRPELVNTTYTSIGHVSSEILTFMARKGIDREVETYLNFRIQTSVIEAGFTYQYALGFVDRIFEQLMPHVAKKTGYYYRCVEGLKDENEQLVLPLEIKQWRKAAIFIAVSIGVSSLLLLLETLIRRKNHRRRGRRKKVRQELLSEAIAVSPTAQ